MLAVIGGGGNKRVILLDLVWMVEVVLERARSLDDIVLDAHD